ncbi:MAG: hypothetical protein JWM76_2836 [Pseudonocardiales bacterium]|nr:hypothetical protein [Pseudonocardiales bacterium]
MTSTRTSTYAQDSTGRQEAARQLLLHPILTATHHPEELGLVRRHATALKAMFAVQLGYPLIVEPTFARLVKTPLDADSPTRPARRTTDDAPFTASTYVLLALVCAALLAPGVGEQILISALVDQVRADGADRSIPLGDSETDRRRIVTAVKQLVAWGVVAETDGSVDAWSDRRQDEALLSIHRQLLAHLLPVPLHQLDRPEATWSGDPSEPRRRRLRRRLVESPAVFRAHLDEEEQDVLSRDRTDLARQLEENFGLTLEVRAEGALAYDAAGRLTDVDFPGPGSLKQAALLLLDELIVDLQPDPASMTTIDGQTVPAVFAPWELVDRVLLELSERYRKVWKGSYVESVVELRRDVSDLLASLMLARPTETGLLVYPFGARYRPSVTTLSPSSATKPSSQPTLFEEGSS